MITSLDATSTLRLVQIIDGLGSAIIGEDDPDNVLNVASGNLRQTTFVSSKTKVHATAVLCWGTSDPFEPKFCTKHFFAPGGIGYEFVDTKAA